MSDDHSLQTVVITKSTAGSNRNKVSQNLTIKPALTIRLEQSISEDVPPYQHRIYMQQSPLETISYINLKGPISAVN